MTKNELLNHVSFLAEMAKKAEAPFEDHVKAQLTAQTLTQLISSLTFNDAPSAEVPGGEEAREAAE